MNDNIGEADALLSVKNLKMYFPIRHGLLQRQVGEVKAVDDVSFDIAKGETFGLVGERLRQDDDRQVRAAGQYAGVGPDRLQGLRPRRRGPRGTQARRRQLQLIFQGSLRVARPAAIGDVDPARSDRVGRARHRAADSRARAEELLDIVELGAAMGRRYPHEMSGGQRQRLGIARALACDPELIVCDEPVSALDVSIQAQIINLFKAIQRRLGISYLFIAHDLAVVRHVSDNIGVMYLGRLVEVTDARNLYVNPAHPYTKALLSAIPITDYYEEQKRTRVVLKGEVPSPINTPSGCAFHPRCPLATEHCRAVAPSPRTISGGHRVACHNV